MGAETKVYVKVVKEVASWVEIYAITTEDAARMVRKLDPDIVRVVEAQYDPPYSEAEEI